LICTSAQRQVQQLLFIEFDSHHLIRPWWMRGYVRRS
jgi:hypothetical protein